VILVAGCGGDSSEEPLSRAGYQAAIRDIAKDTDEPFGLLGDIVARPLPQQDCAGKLSTLQDESQQIIDRIAALRSSPARSRHRSSGF